MEESVSIIMNKYGFEDDCRKVVTRKSPGKRAVA
jgi:hypothetical protein